MKIKVLTILLIAFLISCKSKKNVLSDSQNTTIDDIENVHLKIVDYIIKENLEFTLKLINDTDKSIYIVHPNRNKFNFPEFFRLKITPEIEIEERVVKVYDKPLSEFIKIAPKSELELTYISEKYDIDLKDRTLNGKILEIQILYNTVQYWDNRMRDMTYSYRSNDEILKKVEMLTHLELVSNTINIKIPE